MRPRIKLTATTIVAAMAGFLLVTWYYRPNTYGNTHAGDKDGEKKSQEDQNDDALLYYKIKAEKSEQELKVLKREHVKKFPYNSKREGVTGGMINVWQSDSVMSLTPAKNTRSFDLQTQSGRKLRRDCVQEHVFGALGLDTLKEYFIQGCNYPALFDFENWAERTGCGNEPIDGKLLIHTAWTGPYLHVQEDLEALLNSYLMTQNTKTSKFIFWLMDTDPDPLDTFQTRFITKGGGSIEFKKAELASFAKDTAMEGRSEFLDVNWTAVKKGPRWKANLFRVLILHREGGIWVDTDSLLLRDLRPLAEFGGEFASKLTMSLYFNNNVLALRKKSSLGASMINDILATPDAPFDSKEYCKYVGSPCFPKWTWNHGLIQLAVRQHRGIVIFPTTFTDPAYACYPPWLLAKSGGQSMRDFTISEVLEFIRGSFVLHTRAYNAEKPINPNSNYGRLYKIVEKGSSSDKPVPVVNIKPRIESEIKSLNKLFKKRGERDKIVDPAFVPRGDRVPILIVSDRFHSCINAVRHVKGAMYGGTPDLQATGNCSATRQKFNETVVFLWHPDTGHLRPAHSEPGYVLCIDGFPFNTYRGKDNTWSTVPRMISCNAQRLSQVWTFDNSTKSLRLNYLDLCLEVLSRDGKVGMRPCASYDLAGQKLRMEKFTGKLPW